MKLLILSDLHLESAAFSPPDAADYDVAVLAGDIRSPGRSAVAWAQGSGRFAKTLPVILVPGNHEYYDCILQDELAVMREMAKGSNVHLLDGDELVVEDVRFLACTLWTDFALPLPEDAPVGSELVSSQGKAMVIAGHALTDYSVVRIKDPLKVFRGQSEEISFGRRAHVRPLRPGDTLRLHGQQRDWLQAKLQEPFDGPTVVVTHHAPHRGSLAERFSQDWISANFVTELPSTFFDVPVLWIHGHTHDSFDYQVGNCRVVCNPRGYQSWDGRIENHLFNPGLIVEIL